MSSPKKKSLIVSYFIGIAACLASAQTLAAANIVVSLIPAQVTLYPGGVQRFDAVVTGSVQGYVKWTLTPNVGTLLQRAMYSVYTAPATITADQTLTLTAASTENKASFAQVTIQLVRRTSVSVSPAVANLSPGGTQQFTATVQGGSGPGVTWSLQPNVGSIDNTGLYTAPSSVSAPQTVNVTATSVEDPTQSSTAQVFLSGGVTITMGTSGLTSLKYNGQEFLSRSAGTPSFVQAFTTNAAGATSSVSVKPTGTVASSATNTVTQTFSWGKSTIQYKPAGDRLFVTVTLTNALSQPLTRYWLFPLAINCPQLPAPASTSHQMGFNVDAPTAVLWDYGIGTMAVVNEDVKKPVSLGFWQQTNPPGTQWLISVNVDPTQSLNPNWPAINRPIAAGGTDSITFTLRFGPAGATITQLAGDIFALYSATFPHIVPAPVQRKPIARLSYTGGFRPTYPTNPRGWFNDSTVDVTTPQGIAAFQTRLLNAANGSIAEMTRVGASGAIIWDIEGQQLGTSYIGDPSQAEALAPELVGVLDAFVNKFKSAGFAVGFTLRPQAFTFQRGTVNISGTSVTWVSGAQFSPTWVNELGGGAITFDNNNFTIASVQSPTALTLAKNAGTTTSPVSYLYGLQLNTGDPYSVLQSKVQYATQRWGATLFYVDTTVDDKGNITPASVFQNLIQEFPGVVIAPEWKSPQHYAYTYPWLDSQLGYYGPDPFTMNLYPDAAGMVRVPDDQHIAAMQNTLINAVSAGNTLLFDGWFRHPGNDVVIQAYAMAP